MKKMAASLELKLKYLYFSPNLLNFESFR